MEDANALVLSPQPDFIPRPTYRPLPLLDRPESRGIRLAAGLLAVGIALAYFWFIFQYWAPGHPGVDQNGYLVGGKMLSQTGSTGLKPANPLGFIGNMWVLNAATGINYPKYPVGLPLLYAIMLWTCGAAGPKAAFLVSPISTAMAVLGLYFLARRFAGTFASLAAMLILAVSPVTLLLANNPNSHASCMAFSVWGVFLLVRFWETGSIWRGLLGGFLLGYAVTIRYPEGVFGMMIGLAVLTSLPWIEWRGWNRLYVARIVAPLFVATVVAYHAYKRSEWDAMHITLIAAALGLLFVWLAFLGWQRRAELFPLAAPRNWIRQVVPVIGWAIPVAGLLLFNRIAMGTWTGYDTTNESTGFTWQNVLNNWELFVRKIHDTGLFFILPLGVLGMGLAMRSSIRRGLLLWLWFVPGSAVYLSYYWAPENGMSYLRFFLTLLPPIVVGAAVTIDVAISSASTTMARIVTPLAAGLVVAVACSMDIYRGLLGLENGSPADQGGMESVFRQEANMAGLADLVVKIVPKGSVVIGPTQQLHDIQFAGDFECFSTETFTQSYATRLAAQQRNKDPDDPDPVQPARRDFMLKQVDGKNDEQLAKIQIDYAKKAIDEGRHVFIVATTNQAPALRARYKPATTQLETKVLARFDELPRAKPPEEADGANANDPRAAGNGNGNGNRRGVNGGNGGGPNAGGRGGPNGPNNAAGPRGGGAFGGNALRGNRGGRGGGAFNFRDATPQTWQVIEVVKKG